MIVVSSRIVSEHEIKDILNNTLLHDEYEDTSEANRVSREDQVKMYYYIQKSQINVYSQK